MKADYIPKGEFLCILKKLKPEYATILLTSLETGLRLSDVCRLTTRILVDARPYGTNIQPVMEMKPHRVRFITFPVSLMRELRTTTHLDLRPGASCCGGGGNWLFPSAIDPARHVDRSTVYRALREACLKLGETRNVTPHTARKIYAVEAYKATKDLEAVRYLMGHANTAVTALYAFSDIISG